jgi:hypothetical protein
VRPLSLEEIRAETIYGCFTGEIQNTLQRINEVGNVLGCWKVWFSAYTEIS